MWISAALLGPVCDGRHSSHDVLHYATDSIAGAPWIFQAPNGVTVLETCWWVPVAFGGAGLILGVAHPLLDRRWGDGTRQPPGWPLALLNVACFVLCYDLSGALAQAAAARGGAHDYLALDAPLFACMVAIFLAFERTKGGLLMMLLLATIGPVTEIGLINVLHLYSYTDPDFAGMATLTHSLPLPLPLPRLCGPPRSCACPRLPASLTGIPSWIAWVYAAGGPANGALGRQFLYELEEGEP